MQPLTCPQCIEDLTATGPGIVAQAHANGVSEVEPLLARVAAVHADHGDGSPFD